MSDIQQKLLAVFQVEHKEHLAQIRSLLAQLEEGAGVSPGPELDETFRRAHSLKGAARAVGLESIEKLAHRLETLFSRVREGSISLERPALGVIHQVLDATEDLVACANENRPEPDSGPLVQAIEEILATPSDAGRPLQTAAGPGAALERSPDRSAGARRGPERPLPIATVDAVRVSANNLDQLLRSSGQLLAAGLSQNHLTRQLQQLCRQIAEMEKEWGRVRETAAVPLRQIAAIPEFSRVHRYLGFMDEQLRSLTSQARATHLLQQRGSWTLLHLTQQFRQDVSRVRMAPAESVLEGLRKMVRDLARDEGKQVDFHVTGLEVEADRMVLQALKDPLMHLLRNAISHGIEPPQERARRGKNTVGLVTLALEARGDHLRMSVEDDGRGINVEEVARAAVRKELLSEREASALTATEIARLVFQPGLSTLRSVTSLAGRGMGLSVVHEAVRRLQGDVELRQRDGSGISILLSVPLSIASHRLLLVRCQEQTLAIPVHAIERLYRLKLHEIETVEGKPVLRVDGRPMPLARLARLLNLPEAPASSNGHGLSVMLMRSGKQRAGVIVDAFLAERDSLLQDLGIAASKTAGGIVLEDGSVAVVLNPAELLGSLDASVETAAPIAPSAAPEKKPPLILVVDDSITTRSLEKSILEAHGYRVRLAVDGIEALGQLRSEKADLVIADLQMPRLDGFGLIEEMKKQKELAKIPVIIVTSLDRREDQERGLALGADAYIVKRKFDQRDLLETIRQIL